jgi:DNA-binding LacI/PurR family transcriptional regulator
VNQRRPTIRDVAKAAGVSAPLVSTVLNGRYNSTIGASAETRKRVKRAAERLNYKPSIAGRALAERKSYLIGLLLCQTNASLAAGVIRGVGEIAAARHYSPVVFMHDGPQQEAEELERMQDRQVDGLLVDTFDAPPNEANIQQYRRLAREGYPIIELFGNTIHGVPSVNVDFEGDGRRAVEQFVEMGYRRITLVAPQASRQNPIDWATCKFVSGYKLGVKQAQLEESIVTVPRVTTPSVSGAFVQNGRQAAAEVLALSPRPEAIICFSSRRAIGLVQGLQQRGVKVPDDISVIGFHEPDVASLCDPPLSCMSISGRGVGSAAAELMFNLFADEPASDVLVPSEWEFRESTRPASAASKQGVAAGAAASI